MNKDDIRSWLKSANGISERQPGCPDDETLASLMDGGLSERGHQQLTHHLADCTYCIERVGILGRITDAESTAAVPEFVQAQARKLVSATDRGVKQPQRIKNAPRWAIAAVIVIAAGLALQIERPDTPDQATEIRETRSINPLSPGPSLLLPQEGATVMHGNEVFSWTPVADSLYYQVRIVSDAGDLVWNGRVDETHWQIPTDLALHSGAEYYVRIDAFLTESKALNSDYYLFKTGHRQ